MNWSVEIVTPPAGQLLTVEAAKEHLRVDGSDQDDLIATYIEASRATIEAQCERAVLQQVRSLHLDAFPDEIEVPGGFIQSIDSVTYLDSEGTLQTLAPAAYHAHLAGNPPTIEPIAEWPRTAPRRGAVEVTYTCGWPTADDVPPDLIHAAKLLVGHAYANPEAVVTGITATELPWSVSVLLKRWDLTRQIG